MNATEILDAASRLVAGARHQEHGDKHTNFNNIAILWSAFLRIRSDPTAPLSAADVGHLMALLKVARTQSGANNLDDHIDGAGYLACAGELLEH